MLADKLRARIRAEGPMPFEDYMAACLYDEEFGFFTTGPLRSVKDGDFLTSPEVSPWFGRMLARFVAREQERTGADPFLVVEVGAGSGSLLKPLMTALQPVPPVEDGGDAERSDAGGQGSPWSPVASPQPERPSSSPSGDRSLPPPQGEVPTKEAEGVEESYQPPATSDRHEPGPVLPAARRGDAEERSDDAEGHGPYEFRAVEASPAAREVITDLLGTANVHETLNDLPDSFNGVIIANELLDNLPCALAIRSGVGWVERRVGATDDRFGFVTAPARPEVVAWCDAYAGTVPEGGMVEVQLAASEWTASALHHIDNGALVVIDYGGTAEELEPRRTQGTLRTYRSHHLGPDPLQEPGATDVTVDVNFTAMLAAAEADGATAELRRQDDFLSVLGLREQIREFRHEERDLARSGESMQRLVVRSEATDAETLLHPRGLGDFRVLVVRK